MEQAANPLSVLVPPSPEDLPIINETEIKEVPMVCPLCQNGVKYFYINFREQILMCENTECHFPFCFDNVQYKQMEDVDASDAGSVRTQSSRLLMSPTGSLVSTHAWSEIEKMNRACDEDSQCGRPIYEKPKEKKTPKIDEASLKLKENIASIKGLNDELKQVPAPTNIKNEKWIKNLRNLQSLTKRKDSLLKPEEMEQIEEDKKPQVKINIQTGDNQLIPAILINLT